MKYFFYFRVERPSMGEDIRFARNSQKNIRELIRKQEQAQLE